MYRWIHASAHYTYAWGASHVDENNIRMFDRLSRTRCRSYTNIVKLTDFNVINSHTYMCKSQFRFVIKRFLMSYPLHFFSFSLFFLLPFFKTTTTWILSLLVHMTTVIIIVIATVNNNNKLQIRTSYNSTRHKSTVLEDDPDALTLLSVVSIGNEIKRKTFMYVSIFRFRSCLIWSHCFSMLLWIEIVRQLRECVLYINICVQFVLIFYVFPMCFNGYRPYKCCCCREWQGLHSRCTHR